MRWRQVSHSGTRSHSNSDHHSYPGFDPRIGTQQTEKPIVTWGFNQPNTGPVFPSDYSGPDIICQKDSKNAVAYAKVAAGSKCKIFWSPEWPDGHRGPVLDYLASCNGDCTKVDKTSLKFNKIDEAGFNRMSGVPYTGGHFASDDLRERGNTWTVTIPSYVAKGKYVLRHEIMSLHQAENPNGAQNYPQCINLEITGSGTDPLSSGTPGTALYKPTDPGIDTNIYDDRLKKPADYIIPGPPLYKPGSSPSEPRDEPSTPTTTAPSATPTSTESGSDQASQSPEQQPSSTQPVAFTTSGPVMYGADQASQSPEQQSSSSTQPMPTSQATQSPEQRSSPAAPLPPYPTATNATSLSYATGSGTVSLPGYTSTSDVIPQPTLSGSTSEYDQSITSGTETTPESGTSKDSETNGTPDTQATESTATQAASTASQTPGYASQESGTENGNEITTVPSTSQSSNTDTNPDPDVDPNTETNTNASTDTDANKNTNSDTDTKNTNTTADINSTLGSLDKLTPKQLVDLLIKTCNRLKNKLGGVARRHARDVSRH